MTRVAIVRLFVIALGMHLSFGHSGALPRCVAQDAEQVERRRAMSARIDQLLAESWKEKGIQPAAICSDEEFVRRASLDLAGVVPYVSETRHFLADEAKDKRAQLVDRLLQSPEYPTHMAYTWRQIMLPSGLGAEQLPSIFGVENWLRRQFAANLRYDRMVGDLLVATGGGQNGPALFYTAHQLEPEKLAAATGRIFLGLQLECAQCHDHPFDQWSQTDFWGFAAFFAQLRQNNTMVPGRVASLLDIDEGEVTLPDTDSVIPPRYPGTKQDASRERGTRRMLLAVWMSSRENPYLARAAVNRVWSLLFGRGMVEPVDDMSPQNTPSHPELLDELAKYFVASGYDLPELYRAIMLSDAYQRSSQKRPGVQIPSEAFAVMPVKPLTADQLYNSMLRVLAKTSESTDVGFGQRFDMGRLEFVTQLQSLRSSHVDSYELGVPQALKLMNGSRMLNSVSEHNSRLLKAVDAPFFDNQQRTEILFLATLARAPSYDESKAMVAMLDETKSVEARQEVLSDLLWSLLNSAEFAVNR